MKYLVVQYTLIATRVFPSILARVSTAWKAVNTKKETSRKTYVRFTAKMLSQKLQRCYVQLFHILI